MTPNKIEEVARVCASKSSIINLTGSHAALTVSRIILKFLDSERLLVDGDVLTRVKEALRVAYVQGLNHTPDSTSWREHAERALFPAPTETPQEMAALKAMADSGLTYSDVATAARINPAMFAVALTAVEAGMKLAESEQ